MKLNNNPSQIIETKRLILRPPIKNDYEAWVEFHADELVMKHLGGVQPRAVAWRGFCSFLGSWEFLGFGMFSLIDKETGQWLGRVGPIHPEGWPGDEVGWGVARAAMGKGFALEAAVATMDWAFENLGWEKVIHTIDPANLPSIALAKRLGSYNQGPTKLAEPFQDFRVDAWGQTRAEWLENRKKFD